MSRVFRSAAASTLALLCAVAHAAGPTPDAMPPRAPSFAESSSAARYELLGLAAGIGVLGKRDWNWGSSSRFRTDSEGWFSHGTENGGMDKLGHAYTSYAISEFLRARMRAHLPGADPARTALHSTLWAAALMTGIEILDGYSIDHGFSKEDLVMNAVGLGMSYLRGVRPGFAEKMDFRLEYRPSRHSSFDPFSDYEGQKYRLVLKPSGFDATRHTALRYFEFHVGYEARGSQAAGFTPEDRRSRIFLGVGINLEQVFFKRHTEDSSAARHVNTALKYIQLPGTAIDADVLRRDGQ